MSYAVFDKHPLPERTTALRPHVRTQDVAVTPYGLGFFRGLLLAVLFGVSFWVGVYQVVRALT